MDPDQQGESRERPRGDAGTSKSLGFRVAEAAGTGLMLLSLLFCARYAAQSFSGFPSVSWDSGAILGILGALALYLVSQLFLILAWGGMLGAMGRRPPIPHLGVAFLLAQIGKYLPGNVAQYAGRVELLKRLGPPRRVGATSVVLETLSLIATAALIVAICAALSGQEQVLALWRALPQRRIAMILGLSIPLLAGLAWFCRRGGNEGAKTPLPNAFAWGRCLGLHLFFFLSNGLALVWLSSALFDLEAAPTVVYLGLFAAAWVAGFVTPGAPAGLGVREFLMLTVLGALHGPGTALGITAISRAVTVGGDALGFLLAWPLRKRIALSGLTSGVSRG